MYYALKVFRDHNITQAEIARKIGTSSRTINTFVNGNPTLESVKKLADAAGADMLEFFTPLHKDDPMLAPLLNLL